MLANFQANSQLFEFKLVSKTDKLFYTKALPAKLNIFSQSNGKNDLFLVLFFAQTR